VDLTYDVDGSSPSIRLSLHWPDPPDVSCLLIDSKEGISSLSLDDLLEGLNDEWDSVSLKLPHSLEGQDSLDGNPSVLVESGQGEEVSVDGKIGVGEVEVDYSSAFSTTKRDETYSAWQPWQREIHGLPRKERQWRPFELELLP
jgi:hypothetical protein